MLNQIIISIIEIFGIFALGLVARHLGYIHEEDIGRMSKLVIDILFPFLIFSSIVRNFQPDRLAELWLMPLIGLGLIVFGAVLGLILKSSIDSSECDTRKTFHFFTAINNYGFLPLIIVKNCWGEKALPLLFLLNLGSSIGFWTIGVGILHGKGIRNGLKNIVTPSLVTLIAAIVLTMLGLNKFVPVPLINISRSVGNTAVPFILLLIGASLYNPAVFKVDGNVVYLSICRNLLIPLASIAVLKLLSLPEKAYNIAFIVAIMPASVSSVVLTQRYGGSPKFAAQCAIMTTLLAIITIPILMHFL